MNNDELDVQEEESSSPQGWIESSPKWSALKNVPVRMSVKIPLPPMTLRQLRALSVGTVLESTWPAGEEVPLWASDVTLSWCEFAVVVDKIGARLTRLG